MQSYITREQDYALRITSTLAGLAKEEQMPVSTLSDKLHISKNFAARIVHTLKKSGILGTTQGKYGGVFLKRDADKLSVFEVLDTIGFKTKFNQCLDENYNCEFSNLCKFHRFFGEEERKIHESMKQKMISEFVNK